MADAPQHSPIPSAHIRELLQERKFEEAYALSSSLLETAQNDAERLLLEEYLSTILRAMNRLEEAITHSQKELDLAKAVYGEHHLMVANVLHNLSMTLDLCQRYEEAIPIAMQELALLRDLLPPKDRRIANCILSLAKHHYELGRFTQAETLLNECVERFTEVDGKHSLGVAACLNNLGRIREHQNAYDEAIAFYEDAIRIRKDLLGTHEDTAFTLLNLGTALADLGQYREAAQTLMECRDMYLELGLTDSPYLQAARDNIMLCWNKVCTPC